MLVLSGRGLLQIDDVLQLCLAPGLDGSLGV